MMKKYSYAFSVQKRGFDCELIPENTDCQFNQFVLFNAMLNFGYIPFAEGPFELSDKQIVEFYEYSKDSVFKDKTVDEYYDLLEIASPYTRQIPTITENETFISDSYQMNVAWINDTSTGKMASAPKSYKRIGLELYNFEDELLGSIYPEYFTFYEMLDDANARWKQWTKTERYAFLDSIISLSCRRKIIIPDSLLQAHSHIQ